MHDTQIHHLFNMLEFRKEGGEVLEKVRRKVAALVAKVKEREGRIARTRKEYRIDDAALANLLAQAMVHSTGTYTVQASNFASGATRGGRSRRAAPAEITVPAGVVSGLATENELIQSERAQIARLELMQRNLSPSSLHRLSFQELEYLGF